MKALARHIAELLTSEITGTGQDVTEKVERRIQFFGPPFDILHEVLELLTERRLARPALLVSSEPITRNPAPGVSGTCDLHHLLTLRNDPRAPGFVAMLAPGVIPERSVTTTADSYGVAQAISTGAATFDEWWADAFVAGLVEDGILMAWPREIANPDEHEERVERVRVCAADSDGIDLEPDRRSAAWNVVARLFDFASTAQGLEPNEKNDRFQYAMGIPRGNDPARSQPEKALASLASASKRGFEEVIRRARANNQRDMEEPVRSEIESALTGFLQDIRLSCPFSSEFARAPSFFYGPGSNATVGDPPAWWLVLNGTIWVSLLDDDIATPDTHHTHRLAVANPLLPLSDGIAVVVDSASLTVRVTGQTGASDTVAEVAMLGRRGSDARQTRTIELLDGTGEAEFDVPSSLEPCTFRSNVNGTAPAKVKVVSLANWEPGFWIQTDRVKNIRFPEATSRGARPRDTPVVELNLTDSGSHVLKIVVSDNVSIETIHIIDDDLFGDSQDSQDGDADPGAGVISVPRFTSYPGYLLGHHRVECDGTITLEIQVGRTESDGARTVIPYRVVLTCPQTDAPDSGSEFDRLVAENRTGKRHGRPHGPKGGASRLEEWARNSQRGALSWSPLVLGHDFDLAGPIPQSSPDRAPILSRSTFGNDPRPTVEQMTPPEHIHVQFLKARTAIIQELSESGYGSLSDAPLGEWYQSTSQETFRASIDAYLGAYLEWLSADPTAAKWCDTVLLCSADASGLTLSDTPDAILINPMHPIRIAWHCAAQRVLAEAIEGGFHCAVAGILDPDCLPDSLVLASRDPFGNKVLRQYIGLPCTSRYWTVLWNEQRLKDVDTVGPAVISVARLGFAIDGLGSGISKTQVRRALDDVGRIFAAKAVTTVAILGTSWPSPGCDDGITSWCKDVLGAESPRLGARRLDIFDGRDQGARPDDATLINLVSDTGGALRWFASTTTKSHSNLSIIPHINPVNSSVSTTHVGTVGSAGALVRHRIRMQAPAPGRYLFETRRATSLPCDGLPLETLLSRAIVAIEASEDAPTGLAYTFDPYTQAIGDEFTNHGSDFVAVASSLLDPACFVGPWLDGAFLWDYRLPEFAEETGGASGSYLISQPRQTDRDSIRRTAVTAQLGEPSDTAIVQMIKEIAGRGIPTVREVTGEDTYALGALGVTVTARILQDAFRGPGRSGILPVVHESKSQVLINLVIPVDPFSPMLRDLARSNGRRSDPITTARRSDLAVMGFAIRPDNSVSLRFTPIEVKFRSRGMSDEESRDALGQARALGDNLRWIESQAMKSPLWNLAFRHLMLSMATFGIRLYAQLPGLSVNGELIDHKWWASMQERMASQLLSGSASISIDGRGRLVIVNAGQAGTTELRDFDDDGFSETITITSSDAGVFIDGDSGEIVRLLRDRIGNWDLEAHLREDPQTDTPPSQAPKTDMMKVPDPPIVTAIDKPKVTPSVKVDRVEPGPPETISEGVSVIVGKDLNVIPPRDIFLDLSDTKINQLNIGIVGDLGTGKTQFLKSLIYQTVSRARQNRGIAPKFLIIDYKNDYTDDAFLKAVGGRSVMPYQMPLNLFDTTGMPIVNNEVSERFRFFADILDKIYGGIGPVQRSRLKTAVTAAYAQSSPKIPTIYDVLAEYERINPVPDSISGIIGEFCDLEVFGRNLPLGATFEQFFHGVTVVPLHRLGQDTRTKNMVVVTIINMFYEYLLRLKKQPILGTDPSRRFIDSFIVIDEADNMMRHKFEVLRQVLLQGREFGVGTILSSQYLSHFKVGREDYTEPLLTWFIHKVPAIAPRELTQLGFGGDMNTLAIQVATLSNHYLLFKTSTEQGRLIRGNPYFELLNS